MQKIMLSFVAIFCMANYSFADMSQEQKESYAIGASTGSYIQNQLHNQAKLGVKHDLNAVIDGLMDALKNKIKFSDDEIITLLNDRAEKLNQISEKNKKAELEKNKKIGKEYMAKNAKNKDVKVTKSGLQYQMLAPGNGEKAKPESIVVVNYKAYLPDGKEFENTYEKKVPAYLSLVSVIDGFKESILLMDVGSKYKFVMPSDIAYGDEGNDVIPGGGVVTFEIELLKVYKPGEKVEVPKNPAPKK
ncbi:MAG: FKBP-type peptidyl-prolyl cis-trans isomerase [Campylobacter sp.]|nr:FKBP-type peptidyl-prolyl cis-trans isomerase [Campylobacter sp.]